MTINFFDLVGQFQQIFAPLALRYWLDNTISCWQYKKIINAV